MGVLGLFLLIIDEVPYLSCKMIETVCAIYLDWMGLVVATVFGVWLDMVEEWSGTRIRFTFTKARGKKPKPVLERISTPRRDFAIGGRKPYPIDVNTHRPL